MTYTKLESKLNTIDRAVRKHYLHNDTEAIIRLAWRMGYDGDFYFSNESRKLISKLGITEAISQAYLDGQNDQLIYWKKFNFLLDFYEKNLYITIMIKIEKNQNFTKFFNVFAFGVLIDQVESRAKARRIALQLASEHDESHIFIVDTNEFIPTSES